MPATINGIGTRYSGKRDLQVEDGICGSCGKTARLSSYDTRLWFCVLFVPVIPLGRKRVLAECSRCRRHRVMPLDKYHEFQQETLTQLEADWRRDRTDLDKAIAYNSALREFGRADEASSHLAELLRTFADDARAQFYAGAVCEATGREEEARRFFALAFQIDPTFPPARRARALQMIQEGSLDQASTLLSPSSLAPEETDPALLFQLAEGYRERGDHVNALAVDQRLVRDFPGIDQGKEFRRAVKRSEKALASPGTILAQRRLPWGRLVTAAALVLLLVGGGLGYNLYRQRHHQVHIVNGYPGPVTVSIDDDELAFAGTGRQVVAVGEGSHRVVASGAIEDEVDFAIEGTFWSRFGADPVYLVNLRGLAVVLQEDVTYSATPRDSADPQLRFLAGEPFAVVPDVDYAFVELPEEIDLPSSSSAVQKRHLDLLEGGPELLSGWVAAEGGPETGLAYVEAWLDVAPSDLLALTYSSIAARAGETRRAVERLRSGLTLEPPNVDWHRAYQQAAQVEDLAALKTEYARYLSAAPGDPDLLYLCGRIEPDPALALSYYDRALSAAPQHPFALRASAYTLSSLGRFRGAAELLQSSIDLGEADAEVVDSYLDAAIAAGDDDAVRNVIEARLLAQGEDFGWDDASRLALVELRAGEQEKAHDLAARLTQAEDDPFHPWIESQLLYAENDIGALRELIRRDDFPYPWRDQMEFWVAVESNDLRAANQALRQMDAATSDGLNELVASLLFARAGMADAAEEWGAAGLENLGRSRPEVAVAQELLAGELPLSRAAVDLLAVEPRYKAPILTLLALEFVDDRDWLLAEAGRFNYLPRFPYHFLRSFTENPSPAS
jgi:tetratricopeptide (TPR) repeat protein